MYYFIIIYDNIQAYYTTKNIKRSRVFPKILYNFRVRLCDNFTNKGALGTNKSKEGGIK